MTINANGRRQKQLEEAKAEKRKANELEKKAKEQGKIAQKALGPKIKKAEKLAGEIQSAMAQPGFRTIVPDHSQKKCDETLATLRSHINLWMNVVTMEYLITKCMYPKCDTIKPNTVVKNKKQKAPRPKLNILVAFDDMLVVNPIWLLTIM